MMDRVLATMTVVFGVPVTPLSTIDDVAEWDSLKHMELVIALEQEFDITFTTEELTEIVTVPLIVAAVERHAR